MLMRPHRPALRKMFRPSRLLRAVAMLTAFEILGYGASLLAFLLAFNPAAIDRAVFSSHFAMAFRQGIGSEALVAPTGAPFSDALARAGAAYSLGRLYPVVGEPVALFIAAASSVHRERTVRHQATSAQQP